MYGRIVFLPILAAVMVGAIAALFWPHQPLQIGVITAAATLFVVLAQSYPSRALAEPLRHLTAQVDRLAEGDFETKIYVGGGDARALAQAINELGEQLAGRFDHLEGDRRRLAGILSGMIEGVVALDAKERVVFANSRAGLLLEFPTERAVGMKFWELVRQRAVHDLVRESGQTREPRRADIEWQGAAPRSLALYAAPPTGAETAGLIVVIHDVSELRRLERLRQEFVANVSHELKTPLAVIKTCAETLLDGAAEDPQHCRPFLEQIDEQSDRLHALILDVLHLARIESGTLAIEPIPVPLDRLAAEAVERHQTRADVKKQAMILAVSAPTIAFVEEEAVDIILDNLIDNALKYTPEEGTITVRTGGNGASVWLEVSDTGVGIPEADLPRVFERFYRVDKARARELGGTGLGLAIVKHLAHNFGGSVSARSQVGVGSTFTVRLPRALEQNDDWPSRSARATAVTPESADLETQRLPPVHGANASR